MSQKAPHDNPWNPSPTPSDQTLHDDGLETITFTGENYPEINMFLRGLVYRLGPDALLIDAPDRTFLVRRGDVVIRYPNGTLGRHRPPRAVSPAQFGL